MRVRAGFFRQGSSALCAGLYRSTEWPEAELPSWRGGCFAALDVYMTPCVCHCVSTYDVYFRPRSVGHYDSSCSEATALPPEHKVDCRVGGGCSGDVAYVAAAGVV